MSTNSYMINSFIICPKCGRMHENRVFVCLNPNCKFEHPPFPEDKTETHGTDANGSPVNG